MLLANKSNHVNPGLVHGASLGMKKDLKGELRSFSNEAKKKTMKLRRPDPDPLIPIRNFALWEERVVKPHAKIAAAWPKEKGMVDVCNQESGVLASDHCINGAPQGHVKLLALAKSHAKTDTSALGVVLQAPVEGMDASLRHVNLARCPLHGEAQLLGEDQADVVVKKHKGIGSGTPAIVHAAKVSTCSRHLL
jgi:hypothetical protein